MKRFLSVLLAAIMILSACVAMVVGVAATNASAEELYLSDITPTSWKMTLKLLDDHKPIAPCLWSLRTYNVNPCDTTFATSLSANHELCTN